MSQDTKCMFGVHKYELIKEETVSEYTNDEKDENGHPSIRIHGLQLICQCKNCGNIKSWFVPTSTKFINRSVRA